MSEILCPASLAEAPDLHDFERGTIPATNDGYAARLTTPPRATMAPQGPEVGGLLRLGAGRGRRDPDASSTRRAA
jgi:hypothetical protein